MQDVKPRMQQKDRGTRKTRGRQGDGSSVFTVHGLAEKTRGRFFCPDDKKGKGKDKGMVLLSLQFTASSLGAVVFSVSVGSPDSIRFFVRVCRS